MTEHSGAWLEGFKAGSEGKPTIYNPYVEVIGRITDWDHWQAGRLESQQQKPNDETNDARPLNVD